MLAYEADPTPEHETTLREVLRVAGRSPADIERTIADLRDAET